jgi:hypothetical protein
VYSTNAHTALEFQAEIEVAAEEITGDMLRDTSDNYVVRLR